MEEKLNVLKEQLKNGEPALKDFEDYYKQLQKSRKEFMKLVEYAKEMKKEEKRFSNLYATLAGQNASELVDKLFEQGNALRNNLGNPFENMGYRLLEQTRAGKKDDVYYGILRIFVSQKKKLPDELIEAFKPIYSDEMFKVFIFSFLSGIIGKQQQQ